MDPDQPEDQPEHEPTEAPPPPVQLPVRRPDLPWDDIRRLYVQGIRCDPGPVTPQVQRILDAVGEGDIFERERLRGEKTRIGGHTKITKVGSIKVVFPRIRGVAHYFGVSEKIVEARARHEDWYALQRMWRAQLKQKAGHLRVQGRLIDVDKIDRRAFAIARMGLKMIHERMQMLSMTVEVMDGEVRSTADAKELEGLARSAQVMHALGRRALGFPVEKVGAMTVRDAAQLAEFGLTPVDGIEEDEMEILGQAEENGVAALVEGARTSVAAELAKDDAERLHGFLSVLGRAQEASRGEDEEQAV